MPKLNPIVLKVCIGVSLLLICFVVWYVYQIRPHNTPKKENTPTSSVEIQKQHLPLEGRHSYSEEEVRTLVSLISATNTSQNSEFYDDSFSSLFKEAFVNYRKGGTMYTHGYQGEDERKYYIAAAKGFAEVYSSKESSDKEKAYALNLINLLYIGSGYLDDVIISSVYTVSPFKEMYEKNTEKYSKLYPELATSKDDERVGDQTALVGVASQSTMGDINTMSYALHPTGYALLRTKMNAMAADSRLITLEVKSSKKDVTEVFKEHQNKNLTEAKLLAFKKQLDDLEAKGVLFEGMTGSVRHEVYVMKTITLWDPLVALASSATKRQEYKKAMKNDFQQASLMAWSLTGRPHVLVMINLHYLAFLVNYGIVEPTASDNASTTALKMSYVNEAKHVAELLIGQKYPILDKYVKENALRSYKPKSYPVDKAYYGGDPYYQLRLLAEKDQKLKTYLIAQGWSF